MDKETLYKYFSRQLSYEERREVQAWADESEENLNEFMSERAFFDATMLHIDDEDVTVGRRISVRVKRVFVQAMKVAAIVAVTLCLSHIYNKVSFEESVPMCELKVPAGQQLNITLADGTNVWLNSLTTLRYPAIFTNDERRVLIDGEGYFEVAKDESKPFKVETSKGVVEVLGTVFNVDAYSKCNTFTTALISGKVKIATGENAYNLKPNQIARCNADGTMSISQIDDFDHFRWKEGLISIRNESFKQIMRKFEKFYGVKIEIERKGVEDFVYTGKFYQADGVRYALRLLQHDIKFEFESDYENNIIHIK